MSTTKTTIQGLQNMDFVNGYYSDKTPCIYTLCFYDEFNGDNFAIFKHLDSFCVGHNCKFDFENKEVCWCWGHYDFSSVEKAKQFINKFING